MKATHQGHCQVCNAIQNIQGRNLKVAKHGYKVAGYGFFNGTCPGSEHLPLEQDKSMVEWSIKWAGERIQEAKASIKEWSAESVRCMFHRYIVSTNRYLASRYMWQQITFTPTSIVFEDGTKESRLRYSMYGDDAEVIRTQNDSYVKYLQKDMDDLKRYIGEQRERIVSWHEEPLIPVGAREAPRTHVVKFEAGYLDGYQRGFGRMATRRKPLYTFTSNKDHAQRFTERTAKIAGNHVRLFERKPFTVEAV